ncbi:MAG: hypothetical protein LQ347_000538 [Umbilicaria vellea]|nr:MAG: hypothetical protein LQ347_000538 [Umbilicaria vellea]
MPHATILGLSGCSSSGKTTLSRLLRSVFPHTFILHEDDFYKPEDSLPFRDGLRDWDCAASIDMDGLEAALQYVHEHASLPPWLKSKEERNEVDPAGVDTRVVDRLSAEVRQWASQGAGNLVLGLENPLAILDGFLLFGESVQAGVQMRIDVKLFLNADYAKAKERRERRGGYVTLEGFWEDPPGYVDRVVWPNYSQEHGFLFEGGNVEGTVNEKLATELGLCVCPGHGGWSIEQVLEWAVETVKLELEERVR